MTHFSPQQLLAALKRIPNVTRYLVAYSGGMDSHVLLHALTSVRGDLDTDIDVVHINHGLNRDAHAWSQHCRSICNTLSVTCHVYEVNAAPEPGDSPEAAARRARYSRLADIVQSGDCVLTAHHQDDQAETVLLQMLRGAGPRGLAAMPVYTEFSRGLLARPLLAFTREELHGYALREGLRWVDDDSNFDTGYQRNFLRHEVLPLLKSRWPSMARTLSRTADHCADAMQLMDEVASMDLDRIRGLQSNTLDITALTALAAPNQRNVLRFWFRQLGMEMPETLQLDRLRHDVMEAGEDRMPLLTWSGNEIRRYRDVLYAMPALDGFDPGCILEWDMTNGLDLPVGMGRLYAIQVNGRGLNAALCRSRAVTVRYRHGGERCKPVGDKHTRSIKKLFQQHGIPPWWRDRIPFIYIGDQLAAVADLWLCQSYQAGPGESGLEIQWLLKT